MSVFSRLSTLDITTIVVISVINGIIGTYWTALWAPLRAMGPVGLILAEFHGGFFSIGAIMCAYIIRKPGVGILAGLITGIAEVLSGNMWGMLIYAYGFLEGLGIEVALALWRYKKFGAPQLMLGNILATGSWRIFDWWIVAYWTLPAWLVAATYVMSPFISGSFWALVGKWIVDALVRTGVLDAFPVAKAVQARART